MGDKIDLDIDSVGAAGRTFGSQIEVEFRARARGGHQFTVQGGDVEVRLRLESRGIAKKVPRTYASLNSLGKVTSNKESNFKANLDLSPWILEQIEELREGDDITVQAMIQLRGEDARNGGSTAESVKTEYTVRVSEWAEILSELGYHDTRVFDLDLTASSAKTRDVLRNVTAKVDRVQRRHDEGEYDSAIRACRDAIESLQHIEEDVEAANYR